MGEGGGVGGNLSGGPTIVVNWWPLSAVSSAVGDSAPARVGSVRPVNWGSLHRNGPMDLYRFVWIYVYTYI